MVAIKEYARLSDLAYRDWADGQSAGGGWVRLLGTVTVY